MKSKKHIALALAAVTLAGCGNVAKSSVYTADEILSAVDYNVSDYVKLPKLEGIKTSVTGTYKVTESGIDKYIDNSLKSSASLKKYNHKTLTDALCKKYLNYKTVKAYRESIRKSVETGAQTQLQSDKKNAVLSYLVSKSKVKIPSGLVKKMTDTEIKQYKAYAKKQKIPYKKYIKNTYGYTDEKKFNDYVKTVQTQTAKQDLVCQAAIKKTKMTVTKSEYSRFVKNYTKSYSMKEKDFYKTYGLKKKIVLIYAQNKILENLVKKANIKIIEKR